MTTTASVGSSKASLNRQNKEDTLVCQHGYSACPECFPGKYGYVASEQSIDAHDETPRGIPVIDGRHKRPKHVLGKRKPNEYVRASKCISHKDGVSTIFAPKRTNDAKTRIVQDADGRWIIQKSEA